MKESIDTHHLIRVGAFGHVGRFRSTMNLGLRFGAPVICRTSRGLESGEFLQSLNEFPAAVREMPAENSQEDLDGELLRVMTPQDHLLAKRLDQNRQKAIDQCQIAIRDRGLPVALIDAEQTFDGKSLYFYFLGEIDSNVELLTEELARTYDATVKFSEFAETLVTGCGPDCGTEKAAGGCGPGGCSGCSLKTSCKS